MLALEDVHTYYGESHILQGVSLHVAEGEIVALLGRNGAGKTTTVRSVNGWTPPRRGRVVLGGRPIQGLPPQKIARMGLGVVPQGRRIFPNLTVRENLEIAGRSVPQRRDGAGFDMERVLRLFPRLHERRWHWGNQLSGGEQSLLSLGRALMTNARCLLMDEPTEGLSPAMVQEVLNVMRSVKQEGVSILLVEQNLGAALSVSDRVYVIGKGRVVHSATPNELRHSDDLKRRFLGV